MGLECHGCRAHAAQVCAACVRQAISEYRSQTDGIRSDNRRLALAMAPNLSKQQR